jgi:pheromone shutdown protein TraB
MSDFWDLRNQTMASNIYEIARKYPGKTIVVLTGFLHRYYLIRALNKLNKNDFVRKEFYQ